MLLSYYIPDIYFCDRASCTVCGVCLSELETSTMKRPRPGLGCGAKKKTTFLWLQWERFGSVSFQIMRITWRSLAFEMEGRGYSWGYRKVNRKLRGILGLKGEEWTGSRTKFLRKWHLCFYIPSQYNVSVTTSRKFMCTVHFVFRESRRERYAV
jgi:hypothetical protein